MNTAGWQRAHKHLTERKGWKERGGREDDNAAKE